MRFRPPYDFRTHILTEVSLKHIDKDYSNIEMFQNN